MAVVGNFYFSIFLRLTWEFLDSESECGGSVYWPNNKIIDIGVRWDNLLYSSSECIVPCVRVFTYSYIDQAESCII